MVRLACREHLPVLLYHALYASGEEAVSIEERDFPFSISVESFLRQLDMIGNLETRTADPPANVPVITFDDAHASHYRHAFPALLDREMSGFFFAATGRVGCPDSLSWKQLREMRSCGMLVGSHGITHRFLTRLSPGELERELLDSRRRIEDELGEPVDALSLPGGRFSSRVLHAARYAGYRLVFTSEIRFNEPHRWILGRYCSSELVPDKRLEAYVAGRMYALWGPISRQVALRMLRSTLGERGAETLLTPARRLLSLRCVRVAPQTKDTAR